MQAPWTLGTDEDFPEGNAALIGPDGEQVATVWNTSDPKQKERAEFIARACSCHDEMREALRALDDAAMAAMGMQPGSSPPISRVGRAIQDARAILAKATS